MALASGASAQEHWSGKTAFILAAVGSAVGLGNLVRFPYVAGDTGGGAFVFVYLLCIVFIGLPVLMAELMVGRRGGGSAVAAITRLAKVQGATPAWAIIGWVGILASFMIVTFYSVLAGWVLHFVIVSLGDLMASIGEQGIGAIAGPAFAGMSDEEIRGQLGGLLSEPKRMILMNAIFMAVTVFIISRGIKGGIEIAARFLMPIFFALLVFLAGFSLISGNASEALSFLFKPDFARLGATLTDGSILLSAIGQAFFSLSLGSTMMLTYGIYMNADDHIPSSSRIVAATDTGVAMVAGLAIFPIIFAFPIAAAELQETGAGLGLLFLTLPLAFHEMPFGALFAIAFFIMTLFAALTSLIALMETGVALTDGDIDIPAEAKARRRVIGSIAIGLMAFLIGTGHALSQVPTTMIDPVTGAEVARDTFFNSWEPLGFIPVFSGMTMLDAFDSLTNNIMLPFGGACIAIFAGWVMSTTAAREELGFTSERTFKVWQFLCRYVAPLFVVAVLIYGAVLAPLLS